ncbi:Whey acidic [Pelobates cultripes]|uniref:Whey acidic n=1 Tax=Pelobates cultripes TaxID=61616 RepID=A0AAD1SIG9_PELCU|nr:Whey acidic [Pelobates cultripes]
MLGSRKVVCLVLLILHCAGNTLGSEKSGECPPERFVIHKFGHDKWCNLDADCPKDKKCCPHDGGSVCKTPKGERSGQCPWGQRTGPRCDDKCTSDAECAPDLKCCMSGCGFNCVPRIGGTQGFCPAAKPYLSPCFVPCTKCPKGQKCCPKNCLDECVPTLPEKHGTCPQYEIACLRASHQMCSSDDNCPNDEKCCAYKCGMACIELVSGSEKPGVCPPERFAISKGDKAKWCNSDRDCLEDMKCCPQSEGSVCKTPAKERSGLCPSGQQTVQTVPRCDDKCTSDSECSPDMKCCMSGCGFNCVLPIGGIVIDSSKMECSLPVDKLHKMSILLRQVHWANKVLVKTFQKLTGLLAFAAKVIPMGSIFTRKMSLAIAGKISPYLHIRVTKEIKEDIEVWLEFLRSFNGKTLWLASMAVNVDLDFYTDAAGSYGFGIYWNAYTVQKPGSRSKELVVIPNRIWELISPK